MANFALNGNTYKNETPLLNKDGYESTTASTPVKPSPPVKAKLNYFLDPSKGGQSQFQPRTAQIYRRKFDEQLTDIHDVRGHEDQFHLHEHGFQLFQCGSAESEFSDDGRVREIVYPEIEELLKKTYICCPLAVFEPGC